jgi:hypothetical protein
LFELLEQSREVVGSDAGAGILDRDLDTLSNRLTVWYLGSVTGGP